MTLNSAAHFQHTEIAMITRQLKTMLTMPLLAGVLLAQSPKSQALLMALGTNSKQMATYQWKQKTMIIRKGNPAGFRLEEVRFDASGQPLRITLDRSEEKKMGPFMARKAAAVKDDVREVMQLAGSYANPQQLAQAIRKGETWEGQGTLRVQSRSVILPMDEMTMIFNGSTYLPGRIDIKTQHEGSPVAIAIDYQQLPNGPAMMSRMTVQIPQDGIIVNVESYDFMRPAGSLVP